MMLKTSSRKINPFWNMIGFTLRKNLGIIIVLCIAALLLCPVSYLVNFDDLYVTYGNRSQLTESVLIDFASPVTIIAAIVVVGFNIINFSFLYKKSSSDVFHAFPLTRTELLMSRFLSGIIATLIPVTLCYVSFGIMSMFNTWMGSFVQLIYYVLHTVIIMLVCSAFSLVFVISAGSMFDLGVSLIGANLALIAVGWIFDNILSETLIGYSRSVSSDIMYNLSPPYFCGIGLGRADGVKYYGISNQSIEFLVRSVIYIAVFIVASIWLYNRRKAEKGGTAYAYKFMYLFCSLLAGICGGFLVGMMFNSNITSLTFWFFMVVGAILTSVIYGTVTNRGFKGVGHSIIMGAVAAALVIAVAVSGATGGFGYSTRVPEREDVVDVYIDAFDEYVYFDDPELVLKLHKEIIEKEAFAKQLDYLEDGIAPKYVNISYNLKGGRTLDRNFVVALPEVEDTLLKIYKSEERLKMIKQEVNVESSENITLYFYNHNDDAYYNAALTKSEAEEFLDAYWKDVQNSDVSVLRDKNYDYFEFSGYVKVYENYYHFQFEVHDSFANTHQFVASHNLIERAKEDRK